MNLFIDTISSSAKIILFDSKKNIIDSCSWNIKGNESSTLIPKTDKLLQNNNFNYFDIKNIVIVNGPGSFTGVRTTVLTANTINYITNNNMTALSYFELFKTYPIIKSSSKRDCFFKLNKSSDIKIIENNKLLEFLLKENIKTVYGEANKELFTNIKIVEKIDYLDIIKNVKFDNKKQIDALYIKKPNIS